MKIDLEYMAKLLNVFQSSDKAHITYNDLAKAEIEVGINNNQSEKFIFHIQIALDNLLIGNRDGDAVNLEDIGITYGSNGHSIICSVPIRLTQTGHDFASTISNNEVLQKLKTEFKDAPFKVVFEGGQKLLQHIMKKKLDAILND